VGWAYETLPAQPTETSYNKWQQESCGDTLRQKQLQNRAHWMCDTIEDLRNIAVIIRVRQQVLELCEQFPVYRVRTRLTNNVA